MRMDNLVVKANDNFVGPNGVHGVPGDQVETVRTIALGAGPIQQAPGPIVEVLTGHEAPT
jgi:hypothetical protein